MREFNIFPFVLRPVALLLNICVISVGYGFCSDGLTPETIQRFKDRDRGPFEHIRWFCNDGSVLCARVGCSRNGGGVQHGELLDEVKQLRQQGYRIANVFAALSEEDRKIFFSDPRKIAPLIVERFLVLVDEGWIYQKAQFYRGAFQSEDEIRISKDLLLLLMTSKEWRINHFLLLREAFRFFPHRGDENLLERARTLATSLSRRDGGFQGLRNKIHSFPEASDVARVREYAASSRSSVRGGLLELATILEELYQPQNLLPIVSRMREEPISSELSATLGEYARILLAPGDLYHEVQLLSETLLKIRDEFARDISPQLAYQLLDFSLELEERFYTSFAAFSRNARRLSRKKNIALLEALTRAAYGSGSLTERAYRAARFVMAELEQEKVTADQYLSGLNYLERVPTWAHSSYQWEFHFALTQFLEFEPLTKEFIPDRLRSGPLLLYSHYLGRMRQDADALRGITHLIGDVQVSSGLMALNSGIAEGYLLPPGDSRTRQVPLDKQIRMVSAMTDDLPPIAGILTTHEGNPLSHVQLLAREMGIPNAVVSDREMKNLEPFYGRYVRYAVSPRGRVEIKLTPPTSSTTEGVGVPERERFEIDTSKISFDADKFYSLQELSTRDSGRIAGPKATELAELKRAYPSNVTEGIVIPFGMYAAALRGIKIGNQSFKEWIDSQINEVGPFPVRDPERVRRLSHILAGIREKFQKITFTEEFRSLLRTDLEKHFGPLGSYGAFIRSDTNVEDLPNFSGAGLNQTVPHVVTFEKILEGIRTVWASPFHERAFLWRQARLKNPLDLFVSVLIMKTVPVDSSGVLITTDVETGDPNFMTVAATHGIGGAVLNEPAESVRIQLSDGRVQLLSEAAIPLKRVAHSDGGLQRVEVRGARRVLSEKQLLALHQFSRSIPKDFSSLRVSRRRNAPADVEFGFLQDSFILFQIRPFLGSLIEQKHAYLQELDRPLGRAEGVYVNMDGIPNIS